MLPQENVSTSETASGSAKLQLVCGLKMSKTDLLWTVSHFLYVQCTCIAWGGGEGSQLPKVGGKCPLPPNETLIIESALGLILNQAN